MSPHPDRPFLFAEFQVLTTTPPTAAPLSRVLPRGTDPARPANPSPDTQPATIERRYLRVPAALLGAVLILLLDCAAPLAAAPHALAYSGAAGLAGESFRESAVLSDATGAAWARSDVPVAAGTIPGPATSNEVSAASADIARTAAAEQGDAALRVTQRSAGFSLQRAFWTLVLVAVMGVCAWLGREQPELHRPGRA